MWYLVIALIAFLIGYFLSWRLGEWSCEERLDELRHHLMRRRYTNENLNN